MTRSIGAALPLVALAVAVLSCGDQAPNVRPTAAIDNPGQDTVVTPGDAVAFRGSADDPDGSVKSHAWDYGDGDGATVQNPVPHTYAARGGYTVTYRVTDNEATTSIPDTVAVVVSQIPTSSIDNPGQDTTIVLGTTVDFQGSSSDGDGAVVTHVWDFGDLGGAAVEDPGDYTYAASGIYTVTYRAVDDDGASSVPDTVTVEANAPPQATIVTPDKDTTSIWPYALDFQGAAQDADGEVTGHMWDFGDGNTAEVEDPGPYAYTAVGSYTVTYQVTDDDGATSEPATLLVTVEESDGVAPEPGQWLAGDGPLLLDFHVSPQGTEITEIDFIFADWQCGGATRNERLTPVGTTSWPIVDGAFTIDATFPAFELGMTVNGRFVSSTTAVGDWTAASYGTTCSDAWGGEPTPPEIAVFVNPDFTEPRILGFGWLPGRQVTLEIDNGADGSLDFAGTTLVPNDGTPRWHEGDTAPYSVAEGDSIGMRDPVTSVGYRVLYVTLDEVDTATDQVSGAARSGTLVMVGIDNPLDYVEGPELGVIADVNGEWVVDFSTLYDIVSDTRLRVKANCASVVGGLVCGGHTTIWTP